MKALFVSNDQTLLEPGSPARLRMRAYADAIGTLHVMTRAARTESSEEGSLTVHGVAVGKLGLRAFAKRACALIEREGIEVVSAQDPFEYGLIAHWATKGTTAKLHLQVHTDFLSPWFLRDGIMRAPRVSMPLKNRIRRAIADRVLPSADGIRVVSARVKDSLVARYGTRIPEPAILPIAVTDPVPEAVPLPPHPFPFALITVSRLEPEKRIEDIIDALGRISDRYPAIGLIIVGEGRERARLERMVARKKLAERVLFAGARADAWGLMRSAQGYIQASAYEGYSRTLIEAALARTPIITTDVGVVGEVLVGYEDVLSSPPSDPAQLAVNMVGLIEDVGAREAMVRSACQKATAHIAEYADLPTLVARDLARTL